ncbi:hypothetical protein [Mucilaginibacter arboris]|uniref:Uncharacterized protein n=1 Tax=Mucilaginibacter arboris TaxID=2682090 RepID=A0A7K1T0V8_9SPHI|nr:hypothetical protein [Mucilaginibacter arboris]MVN23168.1 hypothetical protein [Mucilaginibacter arboris]
MKKSLLLLLVSTLAFTLSFAQTKKDGTPDKRYKANMTVKQKPIPTTKSGKPDMRYKINKKAKQ